MGYMKKACVAMSNACVAMSIACVAIRVMPCGYMSDACTVWLYE